MNPYAAPGTQPRDAGADAERDIVEASPPRIARIAGAAVALAGVLVFLTGAQTLAVVSIRGALGLLPWALAVLGAGELVLASLVFRARAWSVVAAVAASFVLMMAAGVWLIVSLSHGLFQLYAFGAPFASLGAAVMALLAMGPSQRASAARARLKQQGMDLGI
jgi:hypothetical protein